MFFKLLQLEQQVDEKLVKKQIEMTSSSFRTNKVRKNFILIFYLLCFVGEETVENLRFWCDS